MQEFMQLPLVFIWQQQLRGVMQQALNHELSSLPQALQAESTQQLQPDSAPLPSTVSATRAASREAAQAGLSEATLAGLMRTGDEKLPDARTDTASAQAQPLNDSAQESPAEAVQESLQASSTSHQQPAQIAMTSHMSHGPQNQLTQPAAPSALPVEETMRGSSRQTAQPSQAGRVRMPQQATHRGLPKQATPSQPTFLRMCLAELLRLTHPTQSQFQPVLCGWYTQGAVLLVGLGCLLRFRSWAQTLASAFCWFQNCLFW